MLEGIHETLNDLARRIEHLGCVFDIPEKELRIRELAKESLRKISGMIRTRQRRSSREKSRLS